MDGVVWAWPTVLMTHSEAFVVLPWLSKHTARWRQWNPGEAVDFDEGTSETDIALVNAWVERT
jgi:hypothetical protein